MDNNNFIPNLIPSKMHKTVNKIIESKPNNLTISDKISNIVSNFYNNYILPNKLLTFFVVILLFFLVYRYINKKEDIADNHTDFDEIIQDILNENDNLNEKFVNVLPVQIPHYNYIYQRNIQPEENKNNKLLDFVDFSVDPPYATKI